LRSFYEAHKADYADPERRRVSVIRLPTAAAAAPVLEQAKTASAEQWGELVRKHSSLAQSPAKQGPTKNQARPPLELEGDLGLVSAPSAEKGANPAVPAAVRAAVFRIAEPGQVLGEVVSDGGSFYIVRLVGRSPARERTFEEAEQTLRARVLQEKLQQAETKLLAELQAESEVAINEAALGELTVPPAPSR
jgi:parvulin-like peptidyl-prolyl isomerase